MWCSKKTTFNVYYVSQRNQIQFEDDDHAVYMSFGWLTSIGKQRPLRHQRSASPFK